MTSRTDKMSTLSQWNAADAAGRKCYCYPNAVCTPVPLEKQGVTECIVSSLNFTNADGILSLTENYLTEKHLAFSSVTLKAFISFMLNSTFLETQKHRVVCILDDQLRVHPGCASYMEPTYKALLLNADDDNLVGLTLLDFVLSQFEQVLSKRSDDTQGTGYFSTHRFSRRTRKQKVFFDELDAKKPKVDSGEATPEPNTDDPKPESRDVDNLALVLNFLTDILKHELGSVVGRGEDVKTAIICKLIFRFETVAPLNMSLLSKVFTTYKYCTGVPERRALLKLIELVAEACLIVDGASTIDLQHSGRCFAEFSNEFNRLALGDQPPARASELIVDLQPEWLRYRAAHFALENVWEKSISVGLKGISRILNVVLKAEKEKDAAQKAKGERKTLSNVLKDVDWNKQSKETAPGIAEMIALYRNDDIGAVMRLSKAGIDFSLADNKGRTALHSVAQHGSVKCAEYILNNSKKPLNVNAEDQKNKTPLMYALENNHAEIHQLLLSYAGTDRTEKKSEDTEKKSGDGRSLKKLTPSVCKLITILADSTMKLMNDMSNEDRALNIEYHHKLRLISSNLLQLKKNIPNELRMFSLMMDHIKF